MQRDATATFGPGPGQPNQSLVSTGASSRLWPEMCSVRRSQRRRASARSAARRGSFRRCRPGALLAWPKNSGRPVLLLTLLLSAGLLSTAMAQQTASSCPVSLVYAADLGRGGANSESPTFAGRVNITNMASQVLPCLQLVCLGHERGAAHNLLQ